MGRVTFFEIHAEDPERAVAFYRQAFGWDIQKSDAPSDYWLIMTETEDLDEDDEPTPGIDGAILKRTGSNPPASQATPVTGFICTIDVENLDDAIGKVKAAGGTEASAKMEIPGAGWVAYYKDTESNVFGMMQAE